MCVREDVSHVAITAASVYELARMADGDEVANAPLMRNEVDENDNYEVAHLCENNTTSPSTFIWALTFAAGISGLLFGYEYGIIIDPCIKSSS